MSKVISVENISKKYVISHQKQGNASLRDSITETFSGLVSPREKRIPSVEDFWALKDVSFEIRAGERVGFVGGNGAGKSTMLKILSRITEPTQGAIKIKGRIASLLEVGTGFHPELTGRENIFLNGAILGMSKQEIAKNFDEIVAFAEIEKFLDTPVKRYSSGMYVRLAFAVAAHLEPEILIVDEVLAVGDVRFQKKCLGKMQDVGKQGRTILFVSHNIAAVRSLCTRAILLEKGKLIADGTVGEIINKYIGDIEDGRETVMYRNWKDEAKAPQNQSFVIKSIRACNQEGNTLTDIDTDSDFDIEIEFSVKKPDSHVGLTLLFYDNENNLIFSTMNSLEPNWYGKPMPKGIYRTRCKIPGKLLNNGWCNISLLMFGAGFSDENTVAEALRFEIQDGKATRGDFKGIIGGAIRPLLEWNTRT